MHAIVRLSIAAPLAALITYQCASDTAGPSVPVTASGEITANTTWSGEVTVTGLADAQAGDLSLAPGAAARNIASDGTHLGDWQEGDGWWAGW